ARGNQPGGGAERAKATLVPGIELERAREVLRGRLRERALPAPAPELELRLRRVRGLLRRVLRRGIGVPFVDRREALPRDRAAREHDAGLAVLDLPHGSLTGHWRLAERGRGGRHGDEHGETAHHGSCYAGGAAAGAGAPRQFARGTVAYRNSRCWRKRPSTPSSPPTVRGASGPASSPRRSAIADSARAVLESGSVTTSGSWPSRCWLTRGASSTSPRQSSTMPTCCPATSVSFWHARSPRPGVLTRLTSTWKRARPFSCAMHLTTA